MNQTLTNDLKNRSEILNRAKEIALTYLGRQGELSPGRYVPDIPPGTLPENGIGAMATLDFFEKEYSDRLTNSAGPRYFGFVTGGATPASIAADWLVSAYDQNACGSNDSIAPQIERQTIDFFKQLFTLDQQYFGSFVTGATVSNFTNLALARQWVGEQNGIDFSNDGLSTTKGITVLSGTPHSSILKSLSMLGIGRNALVKVKLLKDREAVDVDALQATLEKLKTHCIVVANAGTVNTVDFDDLDAIARLKSRYNFWLHVDAAFGGFAACSDKYAHYLNGINCADSVTVDAHKWLNVPYDAAMQFTRHKHLQLKVFQNSAAYLGNPAESPDLFHYTPENSRRFRALPSWFTLMAYGRVGYREIVERNCSAALHFGELLKSSSKFKLMAPVRMNVVCFTLSYEQPTQEGVQQILQAIRDDGRVFFTPTVYENTPSIRAAVSNWLTTASDMDVAFDALNEVLQKFSAINSKRVGMA